MQSNSSGLGSHGAPSPPQPPPPQRRSAPPTLLPPFPSLWQQRSGGYYPALFTEVAQNYVVPHRPGAIDTRVAKYLVGAFGGRGLDGVQVLGPLLLRSLIRQGVHAGGAAASAVCLGAPPLWAFPLEWR